MLTSYLAAALGQMNDESLGQTESDSFKVEDVKIWTFAFSLTERINEQSRAAWRK